MVQTLRLVLAVYPRVGGEPRTGGSGLTVAEVYPRVGGGTKNYVDTNAGSGGLSPRGRGNLSFVPTP